MSDMEEFAAQPKPPEQETATPDTPPASPAKNKNIVVCCDGTGNEFVTTIGTDPRTGKEVKNSNSNVVKLYTALQLDNNQIAYYHPGVGTLGDPTKTNPVARKWSMVKGLAFGNGFRDNVLDAYRYLMQHYNSGDTVYLFGFSRGAYTARALAGLLHGYGLLCRGNEGHIPYAWRMYTEKVATKRAQNSQSIETDSSFRDTFSHKDFMLHFVGLWDTVSSVGWISTPLRLLHLAQNPTIAYGRHAISIDEHRAFYQDNLWGPPVAVQVPKVLLGTAREALIPKVQDLVQVWFTGVHSDIGGSYKQQTSGLSNITLKWMMDEAEGVHKLLKNGLPMFDPARRDMVLGEPVKPADDPNGLTQQLAPLYVKPTSSEVHPSLKGLWLLLEIFPHRYYDRDDANEKMRIPLGAARRLPADSIVHPSVMRRLREPGYTPVNLDAAELQQPATNPGPTIAKLQDYYRFELKKRSSPWRENWFVVSVVSVVEIALGLWLLARVLRELWRGAVWLAQRLDWLGHHVLPKADYTRFAARVDEARAGVERARGSHTWSVLHWYWPLIVAGVFVLWRLTVVWVRRLRS